MDSRGYNSSTTNAILLSSNKNISFRLYQNVEGNLFHDIFEISRTYLKNVEKAEKYLNENPQLYTDENLDLVKKTKEWMTIYTNYKDQYQTLKKALKVEDDFH